MIWHDLAIGTRVLPDIDWVAGGFLAHTDPYLVWLDVSNFRGVVLPREKFLPIIEERSDRPRYRTNARTIAKLTALVTDVNVGTGLVRRFEVSPGVVNDEGVNRRQAVLRATAERRVSRQASEPRPIVGFVDFGCAFAHRQFRRDVNDPGSTRVLALWDQGWAPGSTPRPPGLQALRWRLPPGFFYGAETHRDAIWGPDDAQDASALALPDYIRQFVHAGDLDERACYRHAQYGSVIDRRATHGTHLLDVATGWPSPLRTLSDTRTENLQQPHDADIVFVQLPRVIEQRQIAGLLRANVYDALRYIESCAGADQPVVVNLSYGGYAGPHDGSSVLEQAMDEFLRTKGRREGRQFDLVIAAGNARGQRLHAREKDGTAKTLCFEWNNLPDDPSDSFVELWLPHAQGVQVRVTAPSGERCAATATGQAATLYRGEDGHYPVAALIFASQVCQTPRPQEGGPASSAMVLLAVNPTRGSDVRAPAPYGRWLIEVEMPGGPRASEQFVHAWCELDAPPLGSAGLPRQGYFSTTDTTLVDDDGTLNAIAHGQESIVVGGHALGGHVAPYSSTGPGRRQAAGSRARHVPAAPGLLAKRGPELLAPCDEHAQIPGIAAAALFGTDTVRFDGTSVAAAVQTRRILDTFGSSEPVLVRGQGPTDDQHPDADLLR